MAASEYNSTRQLSAVAQNCEQASMNSVASSRRQDQHSSDAFLSGASTPDRQAGADGVLVERPAPEAPAAQSAAEPAAVDCAAGGGAWGEQLPQGGGEASVTAVKHSTASCNGVA
jgi:hypothetical protein